MTKIRKSLRFLCVYTAVLLFLSTLSFPVPVEAAWAIPTKSSGTTVSGTSHVLTLPTGIASGDLLIGKFANTNNDTTNSWQSGWTEMVDTPCLSTSSSTVGFRRADGTEGATITITSAAATTGGYVFYRITGHHATTDPEISTIVCGESPNPNPPSKTSSWGAELNLWIAGWGGQSSSTTGYPANYTIQQTQVSGCALAARELNAATEDPDTFTQGNTVWGAVTIVVRPAAGGAPPRNRVIVSHARRAPVITQENHSPIVIGLSDGSIKKLVE